MNTRNRLLLLIGIMAVASLVVTWSSVYLLYRNELVEVEGRLAETARGQARLIEAIGEHRDAESLLRLIEEAHEQVFLSFRTGEVLVVRRDGDEMAFLAAHRGGQHLQVKPVPLSGAGAGPAQRALAGETGSMVGLDYRGEEVVAAFEPIRREGAPWGLVAKVDVEEIRAPFIRVALFGTMLDLGLVLMAAVLFVRFSDPLRQRLEESEQHHRALFDQSFQLLWSLRPDGTVLKANRTALDTAGVIESAVCGRRLWDTRWWAGLLEEQQKLEWAVAEAAAGNLARIELEAHGFGKRMLALDFSLKPVTDRTGRVRLLNAEARDITERKRAEQELAEGTARLNALLENSPLAIVVLDSAQSVVLCNPAFEKLFGYDGQEAKGRALDSLVAPPERQAEVAALTERASKEVVHLTAPRRRRDGSLVEVEIHGVPLVVNGELRGVYAIYQDITERRRAEEERERLLAELQEALANIKTLSGLLPICASCKKIRDDGGYWSQIESYISAHSEAQFSHGICPDCARQLYPEHYQKMFPELYEDKKVKE
jgi:PAS domain S-box-containing protein